MRNCKTWKTAGLPGKVLAVLLSMSLVVSSTPVTAIAEGVGTPPEGIVASEPAQPADTDDFGTEVVPDEAAPDEVPADEGAGALAVAPGAEPVDEVAPEASEPAAAPVALRAPAPTSLDVVYVNASSGDDDNSGASADAALKTIEAALVAVRDGGTINTVGSFELASNLTIDKDVTFRGAGTSENGGIVLKAGTTLDASGKTVTMTGYQVALTVRGGPRSLTAPIASTATPRDSATRAASGVAAGRPSRSPASTHRVAARAWTGATLASSIPARSRPTPPPPPSTASARPSRCATST